VEIIVLPGAEEDLIYWKQSGNRPILKKIATRIQSITENPFIGIGKPEPLKYQLTGCWSGRINQEHRIVYEIVENKLLIHSLKGHYE